MNQARFLPHYHRWSNVETVFVMIKAKFAAAVDGAVTSAVLRQGCSESCS
jgi:hypothetical protein